MNLLGVNGATSSMGDASLVRIIARALHLDMSLLSALLIAMTISLIAVYSASNGDTLVFTRQGIRLLTGLGVLLIFAQITAHNLRLWSPWVYAVGMILLIVVLFAGSSGRGAQRWLDVGLMRFQPSELMKIIVPMMMAYYLANRPLPSNNWQLAVAGGIALLPVVLIAKQPDLGTALLIGCTGIFVIFLAGISWRMIFGLLIVGIASTPIAWHFMHGYQRQRILMMLNPESDPLGAGYHIIQSKIAIGSGGFYGKGWMNGSQSQLDFLPERSTDFIFAVYGEEFGFLGVALLLLIYLFIILRGLSIAVRAQESYSRLLAGSLSLTFFVYLFVNIGMVSGLLPVVGVPLPLISYGGTSFVTLMAAFGILMSIHSDRRLLAK